METERSRCNRRTRLPAILFTALLLIGAAGIVAPVLGGAPGTITSWGDDWYGLVSQTPTGTGFTDVAAGYFHSLALKDDGSIVSWGFDKEGVVSQTPTGTGFTAIAAGPHRSLAVRADGSIAHWGDPTWDLVSRTPTGTGFRAVATGMYHCLALRDDGSIVSWGFDTDPVVSQTPTGTGFIAIAAGHSHSLALRADGSIVSWGLDSYGTISDTPTDTGFIAIAAGQYTSHALRDDGSIVSWGGDANGEVSQTPTGTGFTAIAGGVAHSLALRADGSIVSWGLDSYGTISDTPTGTGFRAVAAGLGHSLALGPAEPAPSHSPVALLNAYGVDEDTELTVLADEGVLVNDLDMESDPLTAVLAIRAAYGDIVLNEDGSFTYTPNPDFAGEDTFTYTASDGTSISDPATVTIVVDPINDAPTASAGSSLTDEDTPLAVTLSGSDVDGDPLTYLVVSAPAHGSLGGTGPALTYTPGANYNGPDAFTFRVNDGLLDSADATVSIAVLPVDDPPVADAQAVTAGEDTPVGITLTGADPEGEPLGFGVVTAPAHGALSGTGSAITYTPARDYHGADAFAFAVTAGAQTSAPATVSITVSDINDPPVAEFGFAPPNPTSGEIVTFTDRSRDVDGSIVGWAWDFENDGTIDDRTQNPARGFAAGTHDIRLTVTDDDGLAAGALQQVVVASATTPPVAGFEVSPPSGTAPLTVQFTDRSSEGTTSWAWDFTSDGTIDSTEQNPRWTYTAAGVYSVSLTASNAGGSDLITVAGAVTVTKSANQPVADFTWATPAVAEEPVQFTDQSQPAGSISAWSWTIGTTAYSVQNPVHTFAAAGDYTVSLRVRQGKTWSLVLLKTIAVLPSTRPPLAADFTGEPVSGRAPLQVWFSDASGSATITAWSWDFGDRTTSTEQNPVKLYTRTGTYTVRLTVTDEFGRTATVQKAKYITVTRR